MTKGKLVTKDGSNTLNVTHVTEYESFGTEYWRAKIDGDSTWSADRTFYKSDWDFFPKQPSVLDQVRAFPIGTKFKYVGGTFHYLKFSPESVVFWHPDRYNDEGTGMFITKFDGDGADILEVIE